MSTPGRADVLWLLDLDLGGGTHRYAAQAMRAVSRAAGGDVTYQSGLEVGAASLDSDSVSLSVRVPGLAALAARVGTFRGRPAALRAYRGENYVEDAAALVGIIDSAAWGDPGEPELLQVQIQRAGIMSADICSPDAILTIQTWGQVAGFDNSQVGYVYPRCLGHAGRQYNDSDTAAPGPAIPLVVVNKDIGTPRSRGLFCAAPVSALQVQWWNVTDGTNGVAAVIIEKDDTGRKVSMINTLGLGFADGDEGYVGLTSRTGWGGGELHRGRAVSGLGDVLLWGSDLFGLGNFDLPRIEAERDRMNRYKIDAMICELGLPWAEWVRANILDQYGLEEVSGPRGVWYRSTVWHVTGAHSRAHLIVGSTTTSGGLPVTPAGPVVETSEEPVTRITIAFAQRYASSLRLTRQCTLAPAIETRPAAGDWRFAVSPLCARGAELYRNKGNPTGQIARTFEVPTTHDTATAFLLAQYRARRHALPHSVLTYEGSHDLLDLPAYSEVTVTDPTRGITDRGAILLPGTVINGRSATARVRMPWT